MRENPASPLSDFRLRLPGPKPGSRSRRFILLNGLSAERPEKKRIRNADRAGDLKIPGPVRVFCMFFRFTFQIFLSPLRFYALPA